MRYLMLLIAVGAITACTSVDVKPLDASLDVQHVCIQRNPKVTLDGFVPMLEEGFARHGIATRVIEQTQTCEYVLTYTALRSWDITTYLSHAELHLLHNGREIANAEFHLNGKGGFAFTKFKGTESKMNPIIDQLLAGYAKDPNWNRHDALERVDPGAGAPSEESEDIVYSRNIYAELEQLDALRKKGIITEEEFEDEKKQLLQLN
jgi:hypothetical protein